MTRVDHGHLQEVPDFFQTAAALVTRETKNRYCFERVGGPGQTEKQRLKHEDNTVAFGENLNPPLRDL
eukprot:scaffold2557_cov121-Cylindrotheca_fusiformis.AAC.26